MQQLRRRKHEERLRAVVDLMQRWQAHNPAWPVPLYAWLLTLCGEAGAAAEGERLHAMLVRHHGPRNTFLTNHLITMYARCRHLSAARRAFAQCAAPNAHSYNALLAATARHEGADAALRLFASVPACSRDTVTYNTLLAELARRGHVDDATHLFRHMPSRAPTTWNTMLTAYARRGQLEHALQLFTEMPERNLVSWNAIMSAFCRNGRDLCEVLLFFRSMLKEGVKPGTATFVQLLQACTEQGCIAHGRELHSLIVEAGFGDSLEETLKVLEQMKARDVETWTTIISAYGRAGCVAEAEQVFESMGFKTEQTWECMVAAYARSGRMLAARLLVAAASVFDSMTGPEAGCTAAMVAAYASNGYPREAIDLFKRMEQDGLPVCERVVSSFMDACAGLEQLGRTRLVNLYARCGRFDQALEEYTRMNGGRDLNAWRIMLLACELNHKEPEVLWLWYLLNSDGLWPEPASFFAPLASSSDAEQLREIFHDMIDGFGVTPAVEHFACVLQALTRLGESEMAADLASNMPFRQEERAWASRAVKLKQPPSKELDELERSLSTDTVH